MISIEFLRRGWVSRWALILLAEGKFFFEPGGLPIGEKRKNDPMLLEQVQEAFVFWGIGIRGPIPLRQVVGPINRRKRVFGVLFERQMMTGEWHGGVEEYGGRGQGGYGGRGAWWYGGYGG